MSKTNCVDAFRTGLRFTYGRVFWQWVDKQRGALSREEFSWLYMKLNAGAYSRGQEGHVTLETIIVILVSLGKGILDLPDLPSTEILMIGGLSNATNRLDLPVDELIVALTMCEFPLWRQLRDNLPKEPESKIRQSALGQICRLRIRMETRINERIRCWLTLFPDDFTPKCADLTDKEFDRIWSEWGGVVSTCIQELTDYEWIAGHGSEEEK